MRLEYINPKEFTSNHHVNGFKSFLTEIIHGSNSLNCFYSPKKDRRNIFSISKFEQGLDKYSWAGQSFEDTQQTIIGLTINIREAIAANNELSVLQNALSILEWGQVYRGCIDWLVMHSHNNELAGSIHQASLILDGSLIKNADEFRQLFDRDCKYRCNSGTTKIFALYSKKSVIYDGRVACAIGMLVHDYLVKNGIGHLPPELNFLMDSSQRNTSKYTSKKYQFASKSDSQNSLFNQALSSLKLNLILQDIANSSGDNLLGFTSVEKQLRAIEAILFMIGYEVNLEHYKNTGYFLI